MLEDLTIKDFALIESDHLEFENGFTVLSGETGAGKSILIGALSFLLGGKADVSQIRATRNEASVSGTFVISNEKIRNSIGEDDEPINASEWLAMHGIEKENDRVLLRRFIRDTGKSGAWINDTPVTRAELAQFSSFLVDIHGQHEHQSLMKISEHRKFLDANAGITTEVEEFTKKYAELVQLRKELDLYNSSDSERLRKLDMMNFAVKEISEAKLKKDEDVELEAEQSRLMSFEKIFSDVDSIDNAMSNSESSIISVLKQIRRDASNAAELDKALEPLNSRLESAFYELSDIADEFSSYKNKLVYDPSRLQTVEDRLSLIYNLKKKYASSVNASLGEVFSYFEQAQKFIESNADGNNKKEKLAELIKILEKEVLLRAEDLSKKRILSAKKLDVAVDSILANLGMLGTKFTVSIKQKEGNDTVQRCGPYGKDDIEFLISANPGNPPMPLAKIASGGELSRVMLALKTIFAKADTVETLVFDEIDTGIGGEVAVAVGAHIKNLSKNRQIFCITHLASIAVYADNQIKIEKSVSGELTSSNVYFVKGNDRVKEIARMLSGDADTAQSMEHAKSLLEKYSGGI
ncbi:DNA repair protein RecN [Treponema sp. Marseille-Q3903]|uniref:DNA repair protein RecN n=1 Tax=Treponema sp. Marseille-Q3903 TaxID=2766703 RepID=UPI001652ACB0|nr:DNA repair protein RecN [Treponema sp. Marseille-Q3903]MBC6713426.1 DNA repair protein RecN [Treponema sp. Marseille-Q3903]